MVGSVEYALQPVDEGFPGWSWVGIARSCTVLACRDVEHLGPFALVSDPLEFEPEPEPELAPVPAACVDGHSTYSCLDVQLVAGRMARKAVLVLVAVVGVGV